MPRWEKLSTSGVHSVTQARQATKAMIVRIRPPPLVPHRIAISSCGYGTPAVEYVGAAAEFQVRAPWREVGITLLYASSHTKHASPEKMTAANRARPMLRAAFLISPPMYSSSAAKNSEVTYQFVSW